MTGIKKYLYDNWGLIIFVLLFVVCCRFVVAKGPSEVKEKTDPLSLRQLYEKQTELTNNFLLCGGVGKEMMKDCLKMMEEIDKINKQIEKLQKVEKLK